MGDKRISVRATADTLSDIADIACATGMKQTDIVKLAVRRLAEAHRFLHDTGRTADDCVIGRDGQPLMMPLVRRLSDSVGHDGSRCHTVSDSGTRGV